MPQTLRKDNPIVTEATEFINAGKFAEAIALLRRAIRDAPDDPKLYNCLAIAFLKQGDLHEAEREVRNAIALDEQYEAAHTNLLTILNGLNKLSEAQTEIKKQKKLFPDGVLRTLPESLILKRQGRFPEAIALLESGDYPQDPVTIIKASCELGLLYDRDNQTDKAFEQFNTFNQTATEIWNINEERKKPYLDEIERCQAVFSKGWVNSWPDYKPLKQSQSPAFIFGFPRSGTTLLQHVLNAHPQIYASEEVPAFARIVEHMQEVSTYPECLAAINEEQIETLRAAYLEFHQNDRNWEEAALLVDKYPLATIYLGAIYRLFPGAKLILSLRHPCDCILSAYMQLFEPNKAMVHFYNVDDIVNLYCSLMDLWQQYQETLDLEIRVVKYEDMVDDLEGTARGLLEFLDMDWNESILDYDSKVREDSIIRTPSYEQVSEKIYTSAQYRWVRYREYLEPWLDQLEPYIKKFGYET